MDPGTASILASLIIGGTGVAGGYMQGQQQANLDANNRRHQLEVLMAQMGFDMDKFEQMLRDSQQQRGLQAQQQTPNRVGWRQQQAMLGAVIPGLRNVDVKSNIPGMNHFIPEVSGGLRIPEGGFGPDVQRFFGPEAMAQGEADLDRAAQVASNGTMPTQDYNAIYGSGVGAKHQAMLEALSGQLSADAEKARVDRAQNLARRLNQPAEYMIAENMPHNPEGANPRRRPRGFADMADKMRNGR